MGLKEFMQVFALVLICLVHLFIGRIHVLRRGKSWLSFSGGAAAAYVFIYLLPKLGYQQLILAGVAPASGWLGYLQHHAYLVAFAGFLVYFGASRAGRSVDVATDGTSIQHLAHPAEAVHLLSVVLYSVLVGYLIVDAQRPGLAPLGLATVALTLHFLGADHVVQERYGALYDRIVRWLMVGAVIAGACIGALTILRPTIVALWFAFLAGAIIINVIEEELPRQGGHNDYWWFLTGAVFFSALILGFQLETA